MTALYNHNTYVFFYWRRSPSLNDDDEKGLHTGKTLTVVIIGEPTYPVVYFYLISFSALATIPVDTEN